MFTIDAEVEIEGVVRTPGAVAVAGRFQGLLDCGSVMVGAQGRITGTIVADTATIDGVVTGDVYARQLRLGETAQVEGRLYHSQLDLATGAFFEGQSRRYPDPREVYQASLPRLATDLPE